MAHQQDVLKALATFLAGRDDLFGADRDVIMLRARYFPELLGYSARSIHCVQSFKPHFDSLPESAKSGALTQRSATLREGTEADLCLYLPTLQREENLYHFALAASSLRAGGTLVSAMANDQGARRYEEIQKSLFGNVESFSKLHSRVFSSQLTADLDSLQRAEYLSKGSIRPLGESGILTRPGIYGWNKIDAGSELLVNALPKQISGRGADLGCGFGYLSRSLLERCSGVKHLHLFEAEQLALDLARENVRSDRSPVSLSFSWHDVTQGVGESEYDFVVMNPPWHSDGRATLSLGAQFVAVAARALKRGGSLYMVSQDRLPYEEILKETCRQYETVQRHKGFKVLQGTR